MSWPDDVWNSLRGSWRLFLRDTGGFDDFDLSVNGFWRSFAVIIPIAPVYLYAIAVQTGLEVPGQPAPEPAAMDLTAMGLVAQWFAWPIVMAVVAHFAGLTTNYVRYIVVYNWSSILVMLAQLAPVLLLTLGPSFIGIGSILLFAVYALVLYYRWYIAQTSLETTSAMAWALVLGDLVLSIGIAKLIG